MAITAVGLTLSYLWGSFYVCGCLAECFSEMYVVQVDADWSGYIKRSFGTADEEGKFCADVLEPFLRQYCQGLDFWNYLALSVVVFVNKICLERAVICLACKVGQMGENRKKSWP